MSYPMQNENSKTVFFIAAAVVLTAAAWFSVPRQASTTETQLVGKKLFPKFTEPAAVASLNVLQFDQKDGRSLALEVAKVNNLWVIPTHGNYPADAKEHLRRRRQRAHRPQDPRPGAGLRSRARRGLSDDAKRTAYNKYGVIDPDPDTVKSTDTGVGTRITMKDAAGQELASAIIGKPVGPSRATSAISAKSARQGSGLYRATRSEQGLGEVRRLDRAEPAESQHDGPEADPNQRL